MGEQGNGNGNDDDAPIVRHPLLGKRKDINEDVAAFIRAQPMFFVATSAPDARINLSPKGLDTFRVLTSTKVGYLDLTGSGNETAAHLAHDGRVTFMFCSFTSKPLIVRLYGRGRAIPARQREYGTYAPLFPRIAGARQIIVADIDSVQCSCGYAVPEMTLVQPRPTLEKWTKRKGPDGVEDYWRQKNVTSIDGLATGLLADIARVSSEVAASSRATTSPAPDVVVDARAVTSGPASSSTKDRE